MRKVIIIDTLTSVDIVEIVKCGGDILEVFAGLFCRNLEYNPYTEVVTDMFKKEIYSKHNEEIYFKT